MHKGSESSSWGQSRRRSRGDAVYSGCLRLLLISLLFCIHSRSLCIFHSYFQTLQWKTGSIAIPGGRGSRGHARGYSGTSLRVRMDWARGGGGGRRWLLFERLVSVWRCPRGCGACYPWEGKKKKKKGLRWGYMPLFKPTHTHAWMGSAHLHILHQKHWGRIIRTLVAIR